MNYIYEYSSTHDEDIENNESINLRIIDTTIAGYRPMIIFLKHVWLLFLIFFITSPRFKNMKPIALHLLTQNNNLLYSS